MTRKVLFRHMLALCLLPNVAAWQFALPRREKRPLRPMYWVIRKMTMRWFVESYRAHQELRAMLASDLPQIIAVTDFRLPFSLSA